MEKYRIRLGNGRVVGPFLKEQISELYAKGHIDGTEECQLFPAGEWLKVLDFDELATIFNQALETQTFDNSTVIRKLSELTQEKKEIEKPQENTGFTSSAFKEAIPEKTPAPSQPEAAPSDPNFPKEFSYKNLVDKKEKTSTNLNIQLEEKKAEVKVKPAPKPVAAQVEDDGNKTIVRKAPAVANAEDNADKTVVNVNTKEYLEQLKKEKAAADKEAEKREASRLQKLAVQAEIEKEENPDPNQATQMFNLSQVRENLGKELSYVEQELDLEKREHESKKAREEREKQKALEKELKEQNKGNKKEEKKSKGMKPVIAIVFACILGYMFFPDEDETPKKPKYAIDTITPQIDFPVPYKEENAEKSKEEMERGNVLYAKNRLDATYEAAKAYKNSLEFKFNGNEALTKLILTYSELLPDSPKDRDAGNEVFKLIQIAKTKTMFDLPMIMGTATFYNHFKKYHAGIKTIEDYLLVNKQKSQKLIAIYIDLLVNAGNLSKAKATIDKIMGTKDKTAEMYASIGHFYLANNEHQKAFDIVEEGLGKFPNSMVLILMKSDIIVYNEDFKTLMTMVNKIKSLEAEHSRRYYAKYLEYFGLLSAVKKQNDEALVFFKEALKIKESPELISKLASLETAGTDKVVELISTSKSMDYMNKAREAVRKKNWENAMSFAIEATDIAPKYSPAKLLLAEIQVKQGFYNNAIETLTKLQQEFPNDASISFALVSAYTQAFKFKDALRLLDGLAASEFKNTPEYLSAMGRYYAKQNDYYQAVTWLQKSINANPLFDEDYYILAQTYLKNRSYQKAKVILTKAMDLDPSSVDYKVAYSKIIYEMDDAETAIGFLRAAIEQTPNDPTLMSEIAIYYYRSGQQKYFDEYKRQLEEMPDRNRNLYQFLIKTAEMDDKPENIVKYAKDLILLEPGDLETRMQLASTLADMKKHQEALEQLSLVEERLPTYPKLLYLRSKILLDMGKKDDAIKEANKELESNPMSEEGNILLGNIYVNTEDYVKAENHFKNAQKINAKSVDALIGMAWISFKRNNIETAMDLYSKVTKLDPNNSYAHKQLGLVYKLMGQGALAIESFKVYLELEPDAKDKDKIKGYIQELQ